MPWHSILIHRDGQFVQSKLISDKDDRSIIVQGHLFSIEMLTVGPRDRTGLDSSISAAEND